MRSILNLSFITLILIVIFSAHPSTSVWAQGMEKSFTLIRNGLLIDGTGSKPVTDGAVLIYGEKIEAVGPLSNIKVPLKNVHIIDVKGATITPGFIDAHVHLGT